MVKMCIRDRDQPVLSPAPGEQSEGEHAQQRPVCVGGDDVDRVNHAFVVQHLHQADKESQQDGEGQVYFLSFATGCFFRVFVRVQQVYTYAGGHGGQRGV